jgi:hypothetical protein
VAELGDYLSGRKARGASLGTKRLASQTLHIGPVENGGKLLIFPRIASIQILLVAASVYRVGQEAESLQVGKLGL